MNDERMEAHTLPVGGSIHTATWQHCCQRPVQLNARLSEARAPPAPETSPRRHLPPASPGRKARASRGLRAQNTADVMLSRRIQTRESTHSEVAFPAFPAKPSVGREVGTVGIWRDSTGEGLLGGIWHPGQAAFNITVLVAPRCSPRERLLGSWLVWARGAVDGEHAPRGTCSPPDSHRAQNGFLLASFSLASLLRGVSARDQLEERTDALFLAPTAPSLQ